MQVPHLHNLSRQMSSVVFLSLVTTGSIRQSLSNQQTNSKSSAGEQEEHSQGYNDVTIMLLMLATVVAPRDLIIVTLFSLISGFFCVCKSGQDLFQIRGQNGILHNCMDPLPELSGKQEVADTANHTLETFYPVSPTIDLQKVQVYQEEANSTGKKHQIWPLKAG